MPIDERLEWKENIRRSRPDAWPPQVIDGVGSSFGPPPPQRRGSGKVEVMHKLFTGVWGVILVIVGAFMGGVIAMRFVNDYPTKADVKEIRDTLAEVRKAQENDQRANETTFATIKSDILWLKDLNRTAVEEPIKPKKPR